MNTKHIIVVIAFVFFIINSLFAQVLPNVGADTSAQRFRGEVEEYRKKSEIQKATEAVKEAEKQKKQIDAATKPQPDDTQTNDPKIVTLSDITFSSSEVLPQAFLDDIKKDYIGKSISAGQINELVNKVNNQYLLLGYIAAKAYLPEQDITGGNLFISLVEGRLNQSKIVDNSSTNANYINRHIKLVDCDIINVNDIQKQILYFNASNDIKARVSLEPGPVYGTTDINLIISEPSRLSLSAFTDNAGQKETGLERYGGYAALRSITGYRDVLNVGGLLSRGSKSYFASYEIPEPWLNTRVGVGFDYSTTEIVQGPLATYNLDGHFYDYYIYVKKPFWVTASIISNFNINLSSKNGANYVDNYRTQDTKTDVLTLSLDNIKIFGGGYLFNLVSVSRGLKLIEGKNEFTKLNYSGEFQAAIGGPLAFNLKARAQLTAGDKLLPSSEQFQIGGINTVRGYSEGLLIADEGLDIMAELQLNINGIMPKFITYSNLYGFFDYGHVYPSSIANTPADYDRDIYSAGGGIRLGFFNRVDGNIAIARTLKEHKAFGENETKILFYAQARIF